MAAALPAAAELEGVVARLTLWLAMRISSPIRRHRWKKRTLFDQLLLPASPRTQISPWRWPALQLRGIQMLRYGPEEAITAEAHAMLERALRSKPNSILVLETCCRFLSATSALRRASLPARGH